MNPDPYELTDPDTPLRLDHLLHLLLTGVAWVAVAVGITAAVLIAWRLQSPATYELHFAVPARQMRWRLWAYISWERLSRRCGLSASEQVTRKDREGRPVTRTRWTHPKLLQVNVSDNCLNLTVQTRMGLTVEDLERAVPAIRDAARAHAARSVVVAPGTVRMELVMREQLSSVGHAASPSALATTRITLGRCENGAPWTLPVAGRHTLIAWAARAQAKGRCFGALLAASVLRSRPAWST